MTTVTADGDLVADFVKKGSENAFRALVSRHLDLVYGTALRHLGDSGAAEEVAQNVFITLARKAPRLGGVETLAGWLHRTAVFEAKARIRAELRRRRREDAAVEIASIQREGASVLDSLTPLLDEGLFHLREGDRLALVLRFLEERSLREVGAAMGVDEDAARKRVSRALERLTRFYRDQGFTTAAISGGAVVLANAVKAAPAGLTVSATNAGLAASGAANGVNLVLFHLMALTKTQTALVCTFLAAAPLVYQWNAVATARSDQSNIVQQLDAGKRQASELEAEAKRYQVALNKAQAEEQNAQLRLAHLDAMRQNRAPRPVYRWDDNADLVRLPKTLLEELSRAVSAVGNMRGQLNDQIKDILQMSDSEAQAVQGAIDRFLADYQAAEAQKMKLIEPEKTELYGHKPEETRVFEIPALGKVVEDLQTRLFGELGAILGSERLGLFRNALSGWMTTGYSVNSGTAIFNVDRRVMFYKPEPGSVYIQQATAWKQGYMSQGDQVDDIPQVFRAYLQDWIDLVRSQQKPASPNP